MINATRNGQKAKFSNEVWELLGNEKEGWVIDAPTPPKEVSQSIEKPTTPAPPSNAKPVQMPVKK